MQIVSLEANQFSLYSPTTGEKIYDENGINENAKSLVGYWHHEVIDDPCVKNTVLKTKYDEFLKKNVDDVFDFDLLLDFFRNTTMTFGWFLKLRLQA